VGNRAHRPRASSPGPQATRGEPGAGVPTFAHR
jgi:hypothetical protein